MGRVRGLPSVQVTLAIALLLLGFLIAGQIAAEGPRVRYSTEERTPLIDTVLGLRARIGDLEAQDPSSADSLRRLYAALEDARLAGGLIAVSGRGLAFRLEDGGAGVDSLVTAHDVRVLVEELWLAGA